MHFLYKQGQTVHRTEVIAKSEKQINLDENQTNKFNYTKTGRQEKKEGLHFDPVFIF